MKSLFVSTRFIALPALLLVFAMLANAQDSATTSAGAQGGVSALWIFANLSFTGMWAQAKGKTLWRVISFIFGFPGTILTLVIVKAGSERAYGIDMPRKP